MKAWNRHARMETQFNAADRAVLRAAVKIERTIESLLDRTQPLEHVSLDYVVEALIDDLINRNPQALNYLNQRSGEATVRLTNALMDWQDMWAKR